MSGSSRRNFLIASGAGAAAVGAAAALPAAAQARTTTAKPTRLPDGATALVAHVSDPASGTLALFVGEREVTVHDPELVARLAQAAATANSKEA